MAGLLVGLAVAGSPAVAVARGNGEEAKSAEQIYADMRRAVRSLASVRVHRQGTYADHTTFAENLTANRAATHILDQSPGTNESIDVRGARFGRGGQLGSAWLLETRDPRCIQAGVVSTFDFGHVGNLTKSAATTTVNAKRAVEIDDDGTKPGGTPMQVFVALDGPPVPLQIITTAPTTAAPDTCPLEIGLPNPRVASTETWQPNAPVGTISAPSRPTDRTVAFLAYAQYQQAATTLSAVENLINAQTPSDPAALDPLFMRIADAYRAFGASMSAIKFPPAIQGVAQGLITDANNAATTTASAIPAIANGETAPIDQAQRAENTFISNQTAFEAQLRQAL